MAIANKILGQLAPLAATNTDVYTVPTGKQAQVNIFVTNRSTAPVTYRIALRAGGAAISNEHYIAYDLRADPAKTIKFDGIAVEATDVITVYNVTADLSFTATGLEIT